MKLPTFPSMALALLGRHRVMVTDFKGMFTGSGKMSLPLLESADGVPWHLAGTFSVQIPPASTRGETFPAANSPRYR